MKTALKYYNLWFCAGDMCILINLLHIVKWSNMGQFDETLLFLQGKWTNIQAVPLKHHYLTLNT